MGDERVSVKEWVSFFVFLDITLTFLVDDEVCGINDNAICRYFVTCVKNNDVTNDQVPDVDFLHGAKFAAYNSDFFVKSSCCKTHKLVVFHPVVPALDDHKHQKGEQDRYAFDPASSPVLDHSRDKTQNCKACDTLKDAVVNSLLD